MTSQDAFRAALMAPDLPPPPGLGDGHGGPAGRRFDVYRNNVASSLIDALEVGFPAVQKLIGPRNFRAVMGEFLRSHPPDAPMIAVYGARLPGFLAEFAPLRRLPYLPDVARLEQALRESYHEADSTPLDTTILQNIAPDDLPKARFDLAPTLRIIRSRWPVHAIWAYNMKDGTSQPPATPQDVVITRPAFDPQMAVAGQGGATFIEALTQGATVGAAHDKAVTEAPEFDLSASFGILIGGNALVRLIPGDAA